MKSEKKAISEIDKFPAQNSKVIAAENVASIETF